MPIALEAGKDNAFFMRYSVPTLMLSLFSQLFKCSSFFFFNVAVLYSTKQLHHNKGMSLYFFFFFFCPCIFISEKSHLKNQS